MARYYRRKGLFHLKLKKQTVYAIFAVLLVGFAALIALSFFQKNSNLDIVKSLAVEKFGWGAIFLPIVLIALSFLFLRIKASFARPNVPFGLLLSYICLLALTQSGYIGGQIWNNFSVLISGFGAFIILLGMFAIGLIVLFNTSIDEVVKILMIIYKSMTKIIVPLFAKKSKPVFVEKLPIRSPSEIRREEKHAHEPKEEQKKVKTASVAASLETLQPGLIANMQNVNNVWEFPPSSLLSASPEQKADRGDMKHNPHINHFSKDFRYTDYLC